MLRESLLLFEERAGWIAPRFLTEGDHPWLRDLLSEQERMAGRPEREAAARLREGLAVPFPEEKLRLAAAVLRGLPAKRRRFRIPPRAVRAALFGEAAAGVSSSRGEILAAAAVNLGVGTQEAEALLFADLRGERALLLPEPFPGAPELALRANLALARGLLARASSVEIEMEGNSRAVVRQARLAGLLASVRRGSSGSTCRLEVSGPLSLFRHTLLYGRALGSLLPHLPWCDRYRLFADCRIRGRNLRLLLRTGDPILPASEPRRFDSRLEERFSREFLRCAPEWNLVREPEPVEAGGSILHPDFAAFRRDDPSRRWLVEIAGFWTPGYVKRKLESLRRAGLRNLVLCVDVERGCEEGELPECAAIVPFRRRVDADAVLRALTALTEGRAIPVGT